MDFKDRVKVDEKDIYRMFSLHSCCFACTTCSLCVLKYSKAKGQREHQCTFIYVYIFVQAPMHAVFPLYLSNTLHTKSKRREDFKH